MKERLLMLLACFFLGMEISMGSDIHCYGYSGIR